MPELTHQRMSVDLERQLYGMIFHPAEALSESPECVFLTAMGEVNLPSVPSQLPVPHGLSTAASYLNVLPGLSLSIWESKFCNYTGTRGGWI